MSKRDGERERGEGAGEFPATRQLLSCNDAHLTTRYRHISLRLLSSSLFLSLDYVSIERPRSRQQFVAEGNATWEGAFGANGNNRARRAIAIAIAGNSCWTRAGNRKGSRVCNRMRASSVDYTSLSLFLSLPLPLPLDCIGASMLWNAAAAVATRRKRFGSIAGAGRPSTGKFSRAEEGKTRREESKPFAGGSLRRGRGRKCEREGSARGTEGRGGCT